MKFPTQHHTPSHECVFCRGKGGEEARKNPFDDIHDTDAFVAANDDVIAVVFRGTMGIDDWYTNAMLKPRKCPPEWGVPRPGGKTHTVRCSSLPRGWKFVVLPTLAVSCLCA